MYTSIINSNYNFLKVLTVLYISCAKFFVINAEKSWVKHEFKVVVQPRDRDCFYQSIDIDSVFHVSFQVVRGDDINIFITDPNREILKMFSLQQTGSHQVQKTLTKGDYEICIDNTYSHFNSKLVSMYILSFHQDTLMEKFNKDREINETAHQSKASSDKISLNLVEIFTHQAMARFRQTRDEYLIEANNSLVLYWSSFQSILIILCGIFQVYFIRKLFNPPKNKNFK